jgi:hypothetical protein
MIDQRIFEDLQTKIDEETTVRDVSRPRPRLQRAGPRIFSVPSLKPLRTTVMGNSPL